MPKITAVTAYRLDLRLREAYTIAYETIDQAENVILKIDSSDGLTGWRCAAPDRTITNETAEDVLRAVRETIEPQLVGEDPYRFALHMDRLRHHLPAAKSTRCMVDTALHDLLARRARLPLYRLLGGFRTSIPTSITIGILPLAQTLVAAEDFWRRGFRILKLKGGLAMREDVEKVFKLRGRFGPELTLRFDANQGYDVAQSLNFVAATRAAGIEILEQPTRYGNDEALRTVTEGTDIPIMADESLRSLRDAFHLTAGGSIDMVNIKLMKVGGLLEGTHIASVARAGGMEVMVGCLDECGMGIATGLHFALSRPHIPYADLDGHFDLIDDPFRGMVVVENGVLRPVEGYGLGTVPD